MHGYVVLYLALALTVSGSLNSGVFISLTRSALVVSLAFVYVPLMHFTLNTGPVSRILIEYLLAVIYQGTDDLRPSGWKGGGGDPVLFGFLGFAMCIELSLHQIDSAPAVFA